MDQAPVINPPNPYVGNVRVYPGTLVRVSGRPRPNASRFAINFQTGPSLNPRDDLALHLSPCFSPPRIVRNSLQRGAWGLEEAWGNGAVIDPYQSFEIIILVEAEQFKVAINGVHFCEFRHRIPYHQITHLTIDGDLDIERISITASQPPAASYGPTAPPTTTTSPYPPYSTAPGMPMPSVYPNLTPGGGGHSSSHHPGMPSAGPMPTPTSYGQGYPQGGHYPQPGPYPQPSYMGGPSPAAGSYQGGYPQQPHNQPQPGHSSSSPFGSLPIGNKALGTIAGLGLAGAAGAALLSAANPIKHAKKIMKPHKLFKHKHKKGWGGKSSSSSNSSISSRSSFSSNSS